MFENLDYKCPACKTKLIVGEGTKRYETLCEHAIDPNGEPPERQYLVCPNYKCAISSSDVFWDWYGSAYGSYKLSKHCINGLTSPFGSIERKNEIEIYKRGVTRKTMLPSWITFNIFQLYIDYHYTADTDGNVIKIRRSLEFLKKDDKGRFLYGGSWWWGTFKYLWKKFKRNRKYKSRNEFKKSFNRAFVYRAFEFIMKVRFFNSYRKSLKNKNEFN